jgi:outer membrane protein assembly factor BamB
VLQATPAGEPVRSALIQQRHRAQRSAGMLCFPKTLLAVSLTLPLLLRAALRAEDWPQWRGPKRDGVCRETGLLESFPASGLKVRWRVPVGWGFSSPVVAQGRVYLADSEVVKPKAKERVHCFDETTGKALWTHVYEVAYEDWAFDPKQEIGPVATPLVRNGKVYTAGRVGHVFCLDARTGDVLWRRNLDRDYQVGFAPGTPSPLIEGDLLILFIGGKPGACVIALHKDTGKELWRALDESLTFSSPVVISSGGKRQLIVWTQQSVTSLDPATGKTYWRQRLLTSSEYAVSTPVCHKDRLLIGGLMFQLAPGKPAARVLWPASKAPSRRVFSHTSTALLRGDYLFTAKSSGELICAEASTGRQVWESAKVTDLKNGASIHLTPNGDSVMLYTDRGELIRAWLTAQGYHEISRVAVLEPTFPFAGRKVAWSPPAYADRHIFARSGKELICASLAVVATEGNGQANPPTPAEQFRALRKEYDRASSSGVPLTDAERLKFVGRVYKHRNMLAQKFLELAQKYPTDPVALDALMQAVWQVNTTWPVELVGEDTARARAFELIRRDHIRSDKLGPLCQRVSFGFAKEYETFLRAVLTKNPHKAVQATASLSLGQFLNNRLQRVDLCRARPELAKEFTGLYGKAYLAELQQQDRAKAVKEIEAVFEQATERYGDVKISGGDTVAERAKAVLFEIRHLSVGKEAPDIEAEDQDGKRFQLRDYRGKVVLLDFWSYV